MAKKRRRANGQPRRDTIATRLDRVEAALAKLSRARTNGDGDGNQERVLTALRELERHTDDLSVQFRRIAQMQAEIDAIKQAWVKFKIHD